VSGWLVVTHTCLHYFSLSHCRAIRSCKSKKSNGIARQRGALTTTTGVEFNLPKGGFKLVNR